MVAAALNKIYEVILRAARAGRLCSYKEIAAACGREGGDWVSRQLDELLRVAFKAGMPMLGTVVATERSIDGGEPDAVELTDLLRGHEEAGYDTANFDLAAARAKVFEWAKNAPADFAEVQRIVSEKRERQYLRGRGSTGYDFVSAVLIALHKMGGSAASRAAAVEWIRKDGRMFPEEEIAAGRQYGNLSSFADRLGAARNTCTLRGWTNHEGNLWQLTESGRSEALKRATAYDAGRPPDPRVAVRASALSPRRPSTKSQPQGRDSEDPPQFPTPLRTEESYSVDDIIRDGCFLPSSDLRELLALLRKKKNLILQGPPGTGKTWLARRLGCALLGTSRRPSEALRVVQFHPSTSYEDFVRGYRPGGEGGLSLQDGAFLEMVEVARRRPAMLVIEEINRGVPAQIFGELLTLIESTKRGEEHRMRLAYPREEDGDGIHIPDNLHIIGTMNRADRSLAIMDMALRRRFAFWDLAPQFNRKWVEWCEVSISEVLAEHIRAKMNSLNSQIAEHPSLGRHFRIGHSYFTPGEDEVVEGPIEWFRAIVDTEIRPLLEEYWADESDGDALVARACAALKSGLPKFEQNVDEAEPEEEQGEAVPAADAEPQVEPEGTGPDTAPEGEGEGPPF